MEKVVIGLSGGVDSSVAAAVLQKQGYDVIGVTMRLWDQEDGIFTAAEDARRVADKLKIPFHVLDFREAFSNHVIDTFVKEYQNGRTPNPCVVCNRFLKFGAMLDAAKKMGADKIATGHYARVEYRSETGRYHLLRAVSDGKDQSYALYSLTQEQLAHTLMPLGEIGDKVAVREMAKQLELPVAEKPDSMEICFVPDQDYASFIRRRVGTLPPPGDFVDGAGHILGKHRGIVHYTVGQRKGLGIAFGKPMFVTGIDPKTNRVMLGEKGEEYSNSLLATDWNFIPFDQLEEPIMAKIKVRYSGVPAEGVLSMEGPYLRVRFNSPQRAVTPGQAVVFYAPQGNEVIGGATILRGENLE